MWKHRSGQTSGKEFPYFGTYYLVDRVVARNWQFLLGLAKIFRQQKEKIRTVPQL